MEVIGAVASVSQLVAYSKSTLIVLQGLYKELRRDASEWRKQETEIALLLHIVENFSTRHCSGEESLPGVVLSLLLDLSTIAQAARALVASSQSTGPLGLRWAALNVSRELPQVLESLNSKRELLQLFISQNNLEVSTSIRDKMSSNNTSGGITTNGNKVSVDMNADIDGNNNKNYSNSGWGSQVDKMTTKCTEYNLNLSAKAKGEGNTSDANHHGTGRSEYKNPEPQKDARKTGNRAAEQSFPGQGRVVGSSS